MPTTSVGAFKSRRSWSQYLKYCPLCTTEDIAKFGETYWHRQHQLSEMIYCVKHQIRLVDSDVHIKQASTGFYPASGALLLEYDVTAVSDVLGTVDK